MIAIKKVKAKLIKIVQYGPFIKVFRFTYPGIENIDFISGQFAMVSCDNCLHDKTEKPLKRAFSISSSPTTKNHI